MPIQIDKSLFILHYQEQFAHLTVDIYYQRPLICMLRKPDFFSDDYSGRLYGIRVHSHNGQYWQHYLHLTQQERRFLQCSQARAAIKFSLHEIGVQIAALSQSLDEDIENNVSDERMFESLDNYDHSLEEKSNILGLQQLLLRYNHQLRFLQRPQLYSKEWHLLPQKKRFGTHCPYIDTYATEPYVKKIQTQLNARIETIVKHQQIVLEKYLSRADQLGPIPMLSVRARHLGSTVERERYNNLAIFYQKIQQLESSMMGLREQLGVVNQWSKPSPLDYHPYPQRKRPVWYRNVLLEPKKNCPTIALDPSEMPEESSAWV